MITAEPVAHSISKAWYLNTTATLSCKATTTSGIIRYQWRRVNGEITSDRANGVNTSTLTISSITEQDEDEYYCVTNYGPVNGILHNITSNKANIIVYGEQWTMYTFVNKILPQFVGPPTVQPIAVDLPVVLPISSVYYVIAGNRLQLNCRATNDPQSPDELKFMWYRDSTIVDAQGGRRLIFTLDAGFFILFNSLDMNQDNGTYTCSVKNFKLGRAVTQSADVIIESK